MPSGLAEAAAGAGLTISAAARFTGKFGISIESDRLSMAGIAQKEFEVGVYEGGGAIWIKPFYIAGEIDDSDGSSAWVKVSDPVSLYILSSNLYDSINIKETQVKMSYKDPTGTYHTTGKLTGTLADNGWYWNASGTFSGYSDKDDHVYGYTRTTVNSGAAADFGTITDFGNEIYCSGWDDASKSVETPPTSSPGTSFVVKVPKEGKGNATGSKVTSLTFTMTQFDNSSTQNKNVMYVKYDGSVVGQFQHNNYANGWKDAIATISVSHNSSRSGNKVTAKGKVTYKATWDAVANTSVEGDEATYTATVKDTHAVSDSHAVSKSGGINLDNSSTYAKLGTKHTTASYTAYEVSDSHVLGSGTGSANENWYRNSQISLTGSSSLTGGVSIEWS